MTSLPEPEPRVPLSALGASAVIGATLLIMGALLLLADARGHDPDVLLFNPASQYDYWPFAGLVLYGSIFALGSAGVIATFAALHAPAERLLLLAIGAFSLLLAADSFFMLHQHFFPRRGIPKEVVQGSYAALAALGAVLFHRRFRGPGHLALWASLALLAGSLAVDAVGFNPRRTKLLVLEDGLKFSGFCLWSLYWIRRAHLAVAARLHPGLTAAGSSR